MLIPNFAFNQSLTGNRLIYHEPADSATIFNHYVVKQVGTSYGIAPTKQHKYNGTQSAKFELHAGDPEVQSGTRAEITFPTTTNLNRWYSFALFFPGLPWEVVDPVEEVLMQWHQGGSLTPALCIRTKNDSIYLRVVEEPNGPNEWINLGVIEKNIWHPYVMHIIHSSTTSGLIDIWRNDKKILNRKDKKSMYPVTGEVTNPNWKLGIYKSGWNSGATTASSIRVILFDDIKMGNENCSYREMKPMRDY
jgi:hypothetical protein